MAHGRSRHLVRAGWTLIFPAAALVAAALWSPERAAPQPPSLRQTPPPPPWQAPTDPGLLARLGDPEERMMAIHDVEMGHRGELEVTRTIPLPPRNGKTREIQITRKGFGFTSWSWILREEGIDLESGEWAFGP